MPRKKKIVDNETLSKENEEVQEALLSDLTNSDTPTEKDISDANNSIGAEIKTLIVDEPVDLNEVKAEAERAEQARKKASETKVVQKPKKDELKVGDVVKLKSDVETDTLGRRIHNGIRNYTYRVLAVRPDGFISIECLTYAFLVRKDQVNKV